MISFADNLVRRAAYSIESIVQRDLVASLPFGKSRRVALFDTSTAMHVALLLEQVLAKHPSLQIDVTSHSTPDEIISVRPTVRAAFEEHGVTWNKASSAACDFSILLHSDRASIEPRERARIRREFSSNSASQKYIINGDGTIWKAGSVARLRRKLLGPVLGMLSRRRDQIERRHIENALMDDPAVQPGTKSSGTQTLFTFPLLVEQCLATGIVTKPNIFSDAREDAIYDEDYHGNCFLDELKDWPSLLAEYQQRRWRNMLKAGIHSQLDSSSAALALDVGCGTGALAAKLTQQGYETLGIDRSPSAIERARMDFPATRYEVTKLEEVQSLGMKFHLITLSHVLEHAREDAQLLRTLAELLAPGGMLYIEVPWLSREAEKLRPFWHRQADHYHEYTKYGLAELVRECGYTILSHDDSMADEGQEPYQFLAARKAEG